MSYFPQHCRSVGLLIQGVPDPLDEEYGFVALEETFELVVFVDRGGGADFGDFPETGRDWGFEGDEGLFPFADTFADAFPLKDCGGLTIGTDFGPPGEECLSPGVECFSPGKVEGVSG